MDVSNNEHEHMVHSVSICLRSITISGAMSPFPPFGEKGGEKMGFSAPGRQIKILRENYLEVKFAELNEKIDYLITILESGMSAEEVENAKEKLSKKKIK